MQRGKAWPYLKNKLEERLKQVAINQCCRLVYTSGTTGAPKGVMLSHDNLLFTAKTMSKLYDLNLNGQERNVSYLPLSHVAASMMDNFVILSCRGTTYFADKNALKVRKRNSITIGTYLFYIIYICIIISNYEIFFLPIIGNTDSNPSRNHSHSIFWCSKSLGENPRKNVRGWQSQQRFKEANWKLG